MLFIIRISPQVVFVSSLVLTLLDFSPLVFLQEAEGSVGQFDVEITSDGSTGYVSVNYTQVAESTAASTRAEEVRTQAGTNAFQLYDMHNRSSRFILLDGSSQSQCTRPAAALLLPVP